MSGYVDTVIDALRFFARPGGPPAWVSGRSYDGIGVPEAQRVTADAVARGELPVELLRGLASGWSYTIDLFASEARQAGVLPCGLVKLTPETEFRGQDGHVVTEAGAESVRAALNRLPAPSLLVDAGPTVIVAFALAQPLNDLAQARGLLVALAERAGGVMPPDNVERWSVPLCGAIRNWNRGRREFTSLIVHPSVTYTLTELETFTHDDHTPDLVARRPVGRRVAGRRAAPAS